MNSARALADPRVRLGAGMAALLVTAMAARSDRGSTSVRTFRSTSRAARRWDWSSTRL